MIDWHQARQLQQDVGKAEMAEVVALFLAEVDEAMDALQADYGTMDAESRSAMFHFLKGCAANLGFQAFGDQCAAGEEMTKTGGVPDFTVTEIAAVYTASKQLFTDNYDRELG